ncbi:MAG TPA: D-Ala-D-Ala carboxypeptidase family metallohydrolase [Longimicrobiaceae bacterium]|nr:D-Ala-D-Ala carboxypeptidase family metallohydrolase [Longimicrobiaceae bacterium]
MKPISSALAVTLAAALSIGASAGLGAPAGGGSAPHRMDDLARVSSAAFGHSGRVRVLFTAPGTLLTLPLEWAAAQPADVTYAWQPVAGTRSPGLLGSARLGLGLQAPVANGIWRLRLSAGAWQQELGELAVITRVPFDVKTDGYLNGYHIGRYPTEGEFRDDAYAPPPGFIEVTPENQDTYVSEHFRLRDFLTKDQFDVWPKYLALDVRELDKLELVIQELNAMGIRADRLSIMSGYRTPQYNGPGGDGRARLSRHMYGDASDVWVDNDGNGYMDDLNGDGIIDDHDGEVIGRAVDRVEATWPDLTGGCGIYLSSDTHGPFVHIDARGTRSRW